MGWESLPGVEMQRFSARNEVETFLNETVAIYVFFFFKIHMFFLWWLFLELDHECFLFSIVFGDWDVFLWVHWVYSDASIWITNFVSSVWGLPEGGWRWAELFIYCRNPWEFALAMCWTQIFASTRCRNGCAWIWCAMNPHEETNCVDTSLSCSKQHPLWPTHVWKSLISICSQSSTQFKYTLG